MKLEFFLFKNLFHFRKNVLNLKRALRIASAGESCGGSFEINILWIILCFNKVATVTGCSVQCVSEISEVCQL